MRIVWRTLAAILLLLLAVVALQQIAAESGEVVVLTTRDATGATHTTRLWIVEHQQRLYLRAGMPQSQWYQRVLGEPAVSVEREGITTSYRAVPELTVVPQINELMRAKYGWADAFIGYLFGRDASVPVRLEPAPGA